MRWIKRKVMGWVIGSADSLELSDIVRVVLRRYAELFAEEEVIFLSLPKYDREERKRVISAILDMEAQ